MPMPHRTFAEVAKRRLVGKEGSERVATIRALMEELPGYRNGPYADLRKWLEGELERTRVRGKVLHRDSIQVRREGAAQIAFVGPPNAGKSSLLQALSQIQIKTGDYAFTTLRPVPALTRIGGVLVQLVEIPGLIEGANEDRGGGRALLGVLRNADGIVFCHAADEPPATLEVVRAEVAAAGIEKPALLALTKSDEVETPDSGVVEDMEVVAVSVLDDESLDRLREAIWRLTGLIRVYPRRAGRRRRRAVRAHRWRDRRGRRRSRPSRRRTVVHRGAPVGAVRTLRRSARRTRPRRRGRRRRRGRPAVSTGVRGSGRGLHGVPVRRARVEAAARGRSAARLGALGRDGQLAREPVPLPAGLRRATPHRPRAGGGLRRHRRGRSRFTWARATIPSGTSSGRAACSSSSPARRCSSRTAATPSCGCSSTARRPSGARRPSCRRSSKGGATPRRADYGDASPSQ